MRPSAQRPVISTLILLLLLWASSVFAVDPPTASLEVLGFDAGGNTRLRVTYNFPGVTFHLDRQVHIALDGSYLTTRTMHTESGTDEFTLGLWCLTKGEHQLTAIPQSCGFACQPVVWGTPAVASVGVTSPKITSISAGVSSQGVLTVTVGHEFHYTRGPDERFISLIIDDQDQGGQNAQERVGTTTITFPFGCRAAGTYPIEVVATSCRRSDLQDRRVTSITIPQPQASVRVYARYNPATKKIDGSVTWMLPPNTSSGDLLVQQTPTYAENGSPASSSPIIDEPVNTPTGSKTFSKPPLTGARDIAVEAKLTACNAEARDAAYVHCPCDAQSNDPVSYVDGNMRYSDADPLPRQLDSFALTRTYDTYHDFRSLFGRGWWSMFDSRVAVRTSASGDTVALTTASNLSAVFLRRNGLFTQLAPRGQAVPSTMTEDASYYVFRPERSTTVWLYRRSDGRFAGVRDLGTGRQMTVAWNASGLPVSATDSWTDLVWTIATDAAKRRITSITIGSLVWSYEYDANDNLIRVRAPESAVWRTYQYTNNLMTEARDASGNLIESHAYAASGAATSSTGPNDEIETIAYNVAGASGNDTITRVTMKSGAEIDYVLTPVGGAYRPSKVIGGCTACGSRDTTFAYDSEGHVVREQNASGYITLSTYANNRLISTETAMKPDGCDPETSPTRCRLEPSVLATTALDATSATLTTTYEYSDPKWPDRVSARVMPSLVTPGQFRREETQYHPLTGDVLLQRVTVTRSRGDGGETPVPDRTTITTLYGDVPEGGSDRDDPPTSFPPAFDPGGTFSSAWLTLPQPSYLRRSIDGPRADVQDVTSFVYYPIDASVPAQLRGRLAATKNAAGHITRFESYDVFGNVTRMVDSNGVATEMTYDNLSRLKTQTIKGITGCDTAADPLCATDLTSTRTYSPAAGPLESEQRPGGGVTTYEYDARGRVATISRGSSLEDLLERMEIAYDAATGKKSLEKLLAFEDSAWVEKKREEFSYDTLGQLVTITHSDSTSIAQEYDQEGRLSGVRDENHLSANMTYAYDPAGRLATVKQALGTGWINTSYEYDTHGNLTSVTDPNGNVTRYSYDDFGQMVSQQSPVTGTTTHQFDSAGNLIATTDANVATTTRTYDALGRPLTAVASRSGVPTETVSWTYDDSTSGRFGIGRLATMTDPAGATSYFYDRRGLLRKEQRTFSGVSASSVTSFTHDADGNRASITYPSNLTVNYTFDHAGRPLTASGFVSSASYLPFGPLTELRFANNTRQELDYDKRYQTKRNELKAGNNSLFKYSYHRDAAGNITKINETGSDGSENTDYDRRFAYDDLNRLITADTGKVSEQRPGGPPSHTGSVLWRKGSYTWDAMGNILSLKLGEIDPNDPPEPEPQRGRPKPPDTEANIPRGRTSVFTYLGTTPLLDTVTTNDVPRTVRHDAAGNETGYYADREYSPRNLLARVIDRLEPGFESHTVAYAYDGRGIRVVRAESPTDGQTARRYYTYSPEFQLLAVTADDVFNVWETSTPYEIVWFGDRPVAQVTPDQPVRYTVADHLGTPFLQTDPAAAIIWRAEYEPFGNVFEMRGDGVRTDQPLRLPGQELATTWEGPEENYNIFRWYKSGWGRYMQSDPIGLAGGLNLYRYAANNPTGAGDPLGLRVNVICRRVNLGRGLFAFAARVLVNPIHCRLQVACDCDPDRSANPRAPFNRTIGLENLGNRNFQLNTDEFLAGRFTGPSGDYENGWFSLPVTPSGGSQGCAFERCVLNEHARRTGASPQMFPRYQNAGPNSNSYIRDLLDTCGGTADWPLNAWGANPNPFYGGYYQGYD